MENILVTGGLGFIGLHLLSKLSADGNIFIHNVDYNSLDENYFETFLSKDQKSRIKNYINDINEKEVIRHILKEYNIRIQIRSTQNGSIMLGHFRQMFQCA